MMDIPRSRMVIALFLLLPVVLTLSCFSSSQSNIIVTGDYVVRYNPIEGGCWELVGTDNAVYSPINLDNTYRIDGLHMHTSILMRPDMGGFCPGAIVQITELRLRHNCRTNQLPPCGW